MKHVWYTLTYAMQTSSRHCEMIDFWFFRIEVSKLDLLSHILELGYLETILEDGSLINIVQCKCNAL